MRIAGIYSFKGGREIIEAEFTAELREIEEIIDTVDGHSHKVKRRKEKTMPGKMLYRRTSLIQAFHHEFLARGWQDKNRLYCDYPTSLYLPDYMPPLVPASAFREMDFIKKRLGAEIQFGKYAFIVYDICAKMTIFHNEGMIDAGIQIVPLKELANEMSTGVSYFEQFVWDLQHRGEADIDIPVLILGITV